MEHKRRYRKAGVCDVIGSSFAGYLEASYGDLVARFGNPRWRRDWAGLSRSRDQKVQAEWAFKVGSRKEKLVFTIYDYKEDRAVETVDLWHIGAKGDLKRLGEVFEGMRTDFSERVRKQILAK